VALVVLLNGVAAIALLVGLAHGEPTAVKPFADAMLVFAIGSALGLTSAFFAYLSRTFRLERLELWTTWRTPLRWLAVVAAIAGTVCFLAGVNMARQSTMSDEKTSAPRRPRPHRKPRPVPRSLPYPRLPVPRSRDLRCLTGPGRFENGYDALCQNMKPT
jgi:hypothetical protein